MDPRFWKVKRSYVYVWFKNKLPYYIGSGTHERWKHLRNEADLCLIIINDIPKIIADSYEYELIRHFTNQGIKLKNIVHVHEGNYCISSELIEAFDKAVQNHNNRNQIIKKHIALYRSM